MRKHYSNDYIYRIIGGGLSCKTDAMGNRITRDRQAIRAALTNTTEGEGKCG